MKTETAIPETVTDIVALLTRMVSECNTKTELAALSGAYLAKAIVSGEESGESRCPLEVYSILALIFFRAITEGKDEDIDQLKEYMISELLTIATPE